MLLEPDYQRRGAFRAFNRLCANQNCGKNNLILFCNEPILSFRLKVPENLSFLTIVVKYKPQFVSKVHFNC